MVSLTYLIIIGVGILIAFVVLLIINEHNNASNIYKEKQCGLLGYTWHEREDWDKKESACMIPRLECGEINGTYQHTSSCLTCEDVIDLCYLP
jgi:hypothetical protein